MAKQQYRCDGRLFLAGWQQFMKVEIQKTKSKVLVCILGQTVVDTKETKTLKINIV